MGKSALLGRMDVLPKMNGNSMNFDRVLERIRAIRPTGGIFGKIALVLVVVCPSIAAVSINAGIWWLSCMSILSMTGLMFYALKRSFDFAEKNPQAAIMEGAEFLMHERLVHRMKGDRQVSSYRGKIDHLQPTLSLEEVNRDDPEPKPEIYGARPDDEGTK